jgi:hypothetical protein
VRSMVVPFCNLVSRSLGGREVSHCLPGADALHIWMFVMWGMVPAWRFGPSLCSLLSRVGSYVFVRGGVGAICFVSLLFGGGRRGVQTLSPDSSP